jgi:hypothetical protein
MKNSAKINLVALGVVIIVNALANILPLGGMTTGEVSAGYPILLTPAGITFSIWSVIYTLLLVAFLIELRNPELEAQENAVLGKYFLLNCVGNILWILSWHLLPVQISFLVILVLMYSLFKISQNLTKKDVKTGNVFKMAFSIYFGWITIATLVNFCVFCYAFGATNAFSTNLLLTVIFILIAAAVALFASLKKDLPFYAYTVSWALLGIFLKQWGKNQSLAIIALTASVVVLVVTVISSIRRHSAI